MAAYGEGIYECPVTVENEADAMKALEDVRANGVQRAGGVPGQLRPRDAGDAAVPEV